jgi:hypothetical protein
MSFCPTREESGMFAASIAVARLDWQAEAWGDDAPGGKVTDFAGAVSRQPAFVAAGRRVNGIPGVSP